MDTYDDLKSKLYEYFKPSLNYEIEVLKFWKCEQYSEEQLMNSTTDCIN